MSNLALTWAFHLRLGDASAKAVLVALADHADDEDRCWPSMGRLTLFTGLSDKAVRLAVQRLVGLGLVAREGGQGAVARYTLSRSTSVPLTEVATSVLRSQVPKPEANIGKADRSTSVAGAATSVPLTDKPSITPIDPPIEDLRLEGGSSVDEFPAFWAACPRRVGKAEAEKAYRLAVKRAPSEVLVVAMRDYAKAREGEDPKYTAHPSTWLNKQRWLDDVKGETNGKFNGSGHVNGRPKHLDGWAAEVAATLVRERDDDEPF